MGKKKTGALAFPKRNEKSLRITKRLFNYLAFFVAAFFSAFGAFGAAALGATLAGLDFPKEPAAIFPFFVLISPRPIILILTVIKKARYRCILLLKCFEGS